MRILDFSDGFSSSSAPSASSIAFTFANNQSTANVTGALLDSTLYSSSLITVYLKRKTSTGYRFARVYIDAIYNSFTSGWELVDYVEKGSTNLTGEPSGITWSLTSAGQLQYATDNMAGASYTGVSSFAVSSV